MIVLNELSDLLPFRHFCGMYICLSGLLFLTSCKCDIGTFQAKKYQAVPMSQLHLLAADKCYCDIGTARHFLAQKSSISKLQPFGKSSPEMPNMGAQKHWIYLPHKHREGHNSLNSFGMVIYLLLQPKVIFEVGIALNTDQSVPIPL